MNISIPKSVLARELAIVAGVANHKSTIPILSTVRLEAADGALSITGTDLETGVIARCAASVVKAGAICLPAKKLTDLVRLLPDGDVSISVDDKQYATVRAGRSRSRIPGMSVESFPELPAMAERAVQMDARAFARTLALVSFAISQEQSRFTLDGAKVEWEQSLLRAVATDGHRLAYAELDCAIVYTPLSCLMPRAAIGAVAKLADASEGGARVDVASDDNHLFFAIGERLIVARKLAGNFPDYKRVLPTYDKHVSLDREELAGALQRVMGFSDERSRSVRFSFKDGELSMLAANIELGESEESVPIEGAASVEIGFNASYIMDALRAITHERVAVFIKDEKSACELRPMAGAGTEQDPYKVGSGYRVVLAPMRI